MKEKEVNVIEVYTWIRELLSTFIKQIKSYLLQFNQKNACEIKFEDHLLLTFLDQPQSYIVVFETITFQIYNILLTKWKHGIGPNDIITFNQELEFLSTSIIELVNIYYCSHEETIVVFITNKDLNITEYNYVTEYDNDIRFE